MNTSPNQATIVSRSRALAATTYLPTLAYKIASRWRNPCIVFAVLLLSTAVTLTAQDALQDVGVYAFTTELPVEHGTINATNGNLHLDFPLGSFPQRGGQPLTATLTYDSSIWTQGVGRD